MLDLLRQLFRTLPLIGLALVACSANGDSADPTGDAETAPPPVKTVDSAGDGESIPDRRVPVETADALLETQPPLTFMGREIAKTMHWRGATWLLRETREEEEKSGAMLEALGIEPGQVVCDLGCGNGFHTLRMAEQVGPEGRVYAVDVQPQMLRMLRLRAQRAGFENIERVVGTATDPQLPEASCDLILLVDVYHELSYPDLMLAAIHRALKPTGRVALVEFRAEDPDVPIKPLHKMSKAQIKKEWTAYGFRLAGEFDGLPWQHLVFFSRAD